VLREAGWVRSERRGSWVWYYLEPAAVTRFSQLAGELTPGVVVQPPHSGDSARRLPVLQ